MARTRGMGKSWLGILLVMLAIGCLAPSGQAIAADPHLAIGTPTPEAPLTTSEGVASAPWADPFCPPSEGTQNTDPGVPPHSWSSLFASALISLGDRDEVEEVTAQVVAEAWVDYLKKSGGVNPPGFSSLDEAKALLQGRAVSALLDQRTWDGIIQRVGNVYKPTSADSQQFLAHLTDYPAGVESVACDGNDGHRLYKASGRDTLLQLGADGSWAKVIFEQGSPLPPSGAFWTHVPDGSHSYIASLPTANPRNPFGIPLVRVVGELTVSGDENLHSCAVDETSPTSVREQLDADVYESVQQYAGWLALVPQARFLALLPLFSLNCATAPAVYTPWNNGPVVPQGTFSVSPRAAFIAGYTATSSAATIDRWERDGTDWLPGLPFAGPTFDAGFDDVVPRLAISGDGQTVAGCWISGPLPGSGFSLEDTRPLGIPTRYPEIFHFTDRSLTYPSTGSTDPQACGHVSLNESGDTVWYSQRDLAPNWFSSATAASAGPPVLSLPDDQSAEATGPGGAAVNFAAGAQDGAGALPISCSPASGSTFPLGISTVTCSAGNGSGSVQGSFKVTVRDTTGPAMNVPQGPIAVEATGPAGTPVEFAAAASDLVDGVVVASCLPGSGQVFGLGTTPVICTASDHSGNISTDSFDVVVNDSVGPILTQLPTDIVTPAQSPAGSSVSFPVPTADDRVDGARAVACSPVSGSVFPIGTTTVQCSSMDTHLNVSSASFRVTVTPIAIEVPAGRIVAAKDSTGRRVGYRVKAMDQLDGRRVKAICNPASGSVFPLGSTDVSCTASDAHGSSTASFTIGVVDTRPPIITNLPADRRFDATGPGGAIVNYPTPVASDNVDGIVSVHCAPPSGSSFQVGKTTVTCSATDAAGNGSSRSFDITVKARSR